MAQLIRSAKSASDWTIAELLAYNISITSTPVATFFPSGADPSLDHLDPAILTSFNDEDSNLSEATADYLGYLCLATYGSQESVIDFDAATLKLTGFNERHANVATRYIIPLTICGETREAQMDVCVIYRPTTVLLVLVEDKSHFDKPNAEAQVVAQAIAAFQFNNAKRAARALPALDDMTIPCITMLGTKPTFYLVPVTMELSVAVMTGQYPTSQTQVLKCVTVADFPMKRSFTDGMLDTGFRMLCLKRFVAFHSLARSHWQKYLL